MIRAGDLSAQLLTIGICARTVFDSPPYLRGIECPFAQRFTHTTHHFDLARF